jgi:hypothetical protein
VFYVFGRNLLKKVSKQAPQQAGSVCAAANNPANNYLPMQFRRLAPRFVTLFDCTEAGLVIRLCHQSLKIKFKAATTVGIACKQDSRHQMSEIYKIDKTLRERKSLPKKGCLH